MAHRQIFNQTDVPVQYKYKNLINSEMKGTHMDDMFTKRSSDESQEGSPADQHDEADRKRYWNIFLASLARSLASDTDGRLKVVRG